MTSKKKKLPELYLNWKNFIETVQQDARNIFYVADFLFRLNCRLYLFSQEFFIFLIIFQFSWQI